MTPSAVVIGAGLAGLAAADELRRGGVEPIVLEARDRVGGRVWSQTLDNGAVVEMGAEFILPGNTVVRALAERFGLGLWDKGMRYGGREPRGGPRPRARRIWRGPPRGSGRGAGAGEGRGESCGTCWRGWRSTRAPGRRSSARAEVSSASPADLVPASDLAASPCATTEPCPSVAGGNQRLAKALAEALGTARSPALAGPIGVVVREGVRCGRRRRARGGRLRDRGAGDA